MDALTLLGLDVSWDEENGEGQQSGEDGDYRTSKIAFILRNKVTCPKFYFVVLTAFVCS